MPMVISNCEEQIIIFTIFFFMDHTVSVINYIAHADTCTRRVPIFCVVGKLAVYRFCIRSEVKSNIF